MTSTDLVRAYQEGRLSRRELIRGLVALGMSATVATALADRARAASIRPGAQQARGRAVGDVDDTYDDVYGPEAPAEEEVVTLPSTGAGRAESSSLLTKPIAIIGAGAAIAAAGLRRLKGSSESGTA
jgi:hypothetical protein